MLHWSSDRKIIVFCRTVTQNWVMLIGLSPFRIPVRSPVRFSVDRLRVAVKRMLNDVPNSKRNGKAIETYRNQVVAKWSKG